MNNNVTLAMIFLTAGILLTAAVTMTPAAYAGDGNYIEADDESQIASDDCDDNEEALCAAATGSAIIRWHIGEVVNEGGD